MTGGLSTHVPLRVQQRAHRVLPAPMWRLARDIGSGNTGLQSWARETRLRRMTAATAQAMDGPVAAVMHRGERLVARLVDHSRTGEILAENAVLLADAFERAGVDYVVVDAAVQRRRVIAVAERDRGSAWTALATATRRLPVYVRPLHPRAGEMSAPLADAAGFRDAATAYTVFQAFAAAGALEALSGPELGCELEFWQVLDANVSAEEAPEPLSAGSLLAPRRNRWIDALPAEIPPVRRTIDGGERPVVPAAAGRHVFDVDFPVDVVYTWVDGTDPVWQERKAAADGSTGLDRHNQFAANPSRFLSRDELRYSLRSLDMYADWVRHVYLVTDQQVPAWTDTSNPRITVVDHREIFGTTGRLPTFNSHAIESRLHRILGLSNHYLYLNDDVFFGRPVEPATFFHGNGLTKFFLSTGKVGLGATGTFDRPVMSGAKNNRALISRAFDRTVTNKFKHVPHAQRRDVLLEMEERFAGEFERTAGHQFRDPGDLSIAASLHHYYAYLTGRAVEGELRYLYMDIAEPQTEARLRRLLRDRDYDVFCLNDHDSAAVDLQVQRRILSTFLDRYFPLPSCFEK